MYPATHFTPQGRYEVTADQLSNNAAPEGVEAPPQLSRIPQTATVYSFPDFITGNLYMPVPIAGFPSALHSLQMSLNSQPLARLPLRDDDDLWAYRPLEGALAAASQLLQVTLPTAKDLASFHRSGFFGEFAAKHRALYGLPDDPAAQTLFNTIGPLSVTEDVMAVLVDMIWAKYKCPIGLGFVTIRPGQIASASFYPSSAIYNGPAAWVVADPSAGFTIYRGIGGIRVQPVIDTHTPTLHKPPPRTPPSNPLVSASSTGKRPRSPSEETTRSPKVLRTGVTHTPGSGTKKLRVPLPVHLRWHEILDQHSDKLSYNNMLKVAMYSGNQDILRKCSHLKTPIRDVTAVVKRIKTACEWIEDVFSIPRGVFRAAFDQEREKSSIAVRSAGKQEVSIDDIEANRDKIDAALAWIKRGGPLDEGTVARFNIKDSYLYHGVRPTPSTPVDPFSASPVPAPVPVPTPIASPNFGANPVRTPEPFTFISNHDDVAGMPGVRDDYVFGRPGITDDEIDALINDKPLPFPPYY